MDKTPTTSDAFWECECDTQFIHPVNSVLCRSCKTLQEDAPDARVEEINAKTLAPSCKQYPSPGHTPLLVLSEYEFASKCGPFIEGPDGDNLWGPASRNIVRQIEVASGFPIWTVTIADSGDLIASYGWDAGEETVIGYLIGTTEPKLHLPLEDIIGYYYQADETEPQYEDEEYDPFYAQKIERREEEALFDQYERELEEGRWD